VVLLRELQVFADVLRKDEDCSEMAPLFTNYSVTEVISTRSGFPHIVGRVTQHCGNSLTLSAAKLFDHVAVEGVTADDKIAFTEKQWIAVQAAAGGGNTAVIKSYLRHDDRFVISAVLVGLLVFLALKK